MRFLFLISLLIFLIKCQTTINIYNGNNANNNNGNSCSPRKYFGTALSIDWEFAGAYLNEIIKIRPDLAIYTRPSLYSNFTSDILVPVGECIDDFSITATAIFPRREQYLSFTDPIYYSSAVSNNTFFANIPRGSASEYCGECNPVCGEVTLQQIVSYNVPINIYFTSGTFQELISTDLQQKLSNGGASTINTFAKSGAEIENLFDHVVSTPPTTSIEIIVYSNIDNFCFKLQDTTRASAFVLDSVASQGAFPVCPKNKELLSILNSAIKIIRQNKISCDIQIKNDLICKAAGYVPTAEEILNNECLYYDKVPPCKKI